MWNKELEIWHELSSYFYVIVDPLNILGPHEGILMKVTFVLGVTRRHAPTGGLWQLCEQIRWVPHIQRAVSQVREAPGTICTVCKLADRPKRGKIYV